MPGRRGVRVLRSQHLRIVVEVSTPLVGGVVRTHITPGLLLALFDLKFGRDHGALKIRWRCSLCLQGHESGFKSQSRERRLKRVMLSDVIRYDASRMPRIHKDPDRCALSAPGAGHRPHAHPGVHVLAALLRAAEGEAGPGASRAGDAQVFFALRTDPGLVGGPRPEARSHAQGDEIPEDERQSPGEYRPKRSQHGRRE